MKEVPKAKESIIQNNPVEIFANRIMNSPCHYTAQHVTGASYVSTERDASFRSIILDS